MDERKQRQLVIAADLSSVNCTVSSMKGRAMSEDKRPLIIEVSRPAARNITASQENFSHR